MHRFMVIIIIVLLAGCTRKVPVVHEFTPMPENAACQVTMLPLIDQGSISRGGAVFYKIFFAELIAFGHFNVTEEGDVLEIYRQFRMYPNRLPTSEQLRMLGGRLGTTLFIGGDILKSEEHKVGEFLDTDLTVVLRLYDGKTGKKIWSTYHRRRGKDYQQVLHFGRINTLTSLAKKMSQEVINLWLKKGITPCTE